MRRTLASFRRLTRHFAEAIVDNDLIAGGEDLHTPIAGVLAAFVVVSAAVALSFLAKYNSILRTVNGRLVMAPPQSLGEKMAMALDDKALLLGFAMVLVGLITTLFWDALALDARDRAIFGPLPVRPALVLLAKAAAAAFAASGLILALNILPAVLLPVVVLAKAPVGLGTLGRWMGAQAVAGIAGCAWMFLMIVAWRGGAEFVLHARISRRVLPWAQFALVLGFLGLLCVLPMAAAETRTALEGGSRVVFLCPPAWFLGLEEVVIGRNNPIFTTLARLGVTALFLAALAAGAVYVAAIRLRMQRESVPPAVASGRAGLVAAIVGLVGRAVVRDNPGRAAFFFTAHTLARSPRHRLYVASSLGLGLAVAAATAAASYSGAETARYTLHPTAMALAAQLNLVFFLVVGIRMSATLPADLAAGWIFRFHGGRTLDHQIAGTCKAILCLAVVPALAALMPLHVAAWGWYAAAVHFTFGLFSAVVLLACVFMRYERLPFVSALAPARTLVTIRPAALLVGYLLYVYLLPHAELLLVRPSPVSYAWLLVWAALGTAALAADPARSHGARVPVFGEAGDEMKGLGIGFARHERTGAVRDMGASSAVHAPEGLSARTLLSAAVPREPLRPLHGLWADIKLSCRRLVATPQFLVFGVLSLAVGVAVTTTVYSVLSAMLWTPMGIAEPDRVVFVAAPGATAESARRAMLSLADFQALRESQTTLSSLGASEAIYQPLATAAVSEGIEGEAVSGDYFRTAGVGAEIGRTIQPQDDERGALVAVISHRVWRTRFASDPAIVGQAIRLGGQPFEVVGVAPPSFQGINRLPFRTTVWVPLGATALLSGTRTGASLERERQRQRVAVLGRLRPSRSMSTSGAELSAIGHRLDTASSAPPPVGYGGETVARHWSARPAIETSDREWRVATLILGMVGLVLVVACTNLANLILARGAARQQELAVRRALGASRWRLVRELCTESAIIAVLGGMAAYAVTRALIAVATVDVPLARGVFSLEPRLNLPALVIAAGALLLSMLVFGLEPALQLTKGTVTADLAGGVGAIGAPRSNRQRAFIRWQVAISATFFLVAAVLARMVVAEARHDPGIELNRLAVAVVPFPQREWDEGRSRRLLLRATTLLRDEGNLESVSVSSGVPFGLTATPFANLTTAGQAFRPGRVGEFAYFLSATPEIFKTLGVPILQGRAFNDRDDAGAPHVIVVSEKTARAMFGTADALGRTVLARDWGRPPDLSFTVIGVARDTDAQNLMSRDSGVVYVPFAQHYEPRIAVVSVRTFGSPAAAARLIQSALHRADPDAGTGAAGPASILLAGSYLAARVAASLAAALGALTLVLAMVGLYGVQSHIVAFRTREVGVRMAIGASARQIEGMMLREGYRPVFEGLALGLFFGVTARVGVRALVIAQIQPIDPVAFSLVPIPLLIAAFLACYVPARRAARVDPNVALRHL